MNDRFYPEHGCPGPGTMIVDGKLRIRRVPMFNECPDCYAKMTYTDEQMRNKLAVMQWAIEHITREEEK